MGPHADVRPTGTSRRSAAAAIAATLLALLAVLTGSVLAPSSARAADTIDSVAQALKESPVYVDPAAPVQLTGAQISTLESQIAGMSSGVRVFIAVLPDTPEFHQASLLRQLYQKVGVQGVYAATVGHKFDGLDFSSALAAGQTHSLAMSSASSNPGDLYGLLTSFVSGVDHAAQVSGHGIRYPGHAPHDSSAVPAVITVIVLAVLAGGGLLVVGRRRRRRREQLRAEELAAVRKTVEEDITSYGEALDELDFDPAAGYATEVMRQDYSSALDQYEAAKAAAAAARRPSDMQAVTRAVEDGRFALATLAARRSGSPLPERRPPCFFDPRHGPSVGDVTWAPPGGSPRPVPACAADMTRIADGQLLSVRQVATHDGPRPYYNAGPAYGPWAGGYFGGYGGDVLPALMVGTLMGSLFDGPGAYVENNYYGDYANYGGWGDGDSGDGGHGSDGSSGSDGSDSPDDSGWGDWGGGSDWSGGGGDWGGGDSGGSDWGGGGDW